MSEPDRICTDANKDHDMCGCIVIHAREIMKYWTGTTCTWVDDDITALGILAGHAIRAGLHHNAALPKSLIAAIDDHIASGTEARRAETGTGSVHDGPVPEADAQTLPLSDSLTNGGSSNV